MLHRYKRKEYCVRAIRRKKDNEKKIMEYFLNRINVYEDDGDIFVRQSIMSKGRRIRIGDWIVEDRDRIEIYPHYEFMLHFEKSDGKK